MLRGKSQSLREVLLDRIQSGQYPIGSKLPGTRMLAQEFELHPNTVNKVYTDLSAEGVLKTVQGSGTFVLSYPHQRADGTAEAELERSLNQLATVASRLGMSRDRFSAIAERAGARAFGSAARQVWFVECNVHDTEDLAISLGTVLGVRVEPLTTQQLGDANQELQVQPEDLVITTPFHRAEVEGYLGAAGDVNEVGIVPTAETLVSIARLPQDANYSVVASNEPTLQRFVGLLRNYTRREPAEKFVITDPRLEELIGAAEYLFDSQSIHERVKQLRPEKPILTLRYQIEPASVAYVRELLQPGYAA